MVDTTRLRLPLLSAGQAQKELTHNEALLLLDAVSHACCEGGPTAVPPQSPESGRAYMSCRTKWGLDGARQRIGMLVGKRLAICCAV
jgi:hypothetical protein